MDKTATVNSLAARRAVGGIFTRSARLLHNQRALYVKRLLIFEPRVILVSVPYRLD